MVAKVGVNRNKAKMRERMFGRLVNSHGSQSTQNGRDKHVLIASSKSRCPVCHSRKIQNINCWLASFNMDTRNGNWAFGMMNMALWSNYNQTTCAK